VRGTARVVHQDFAVACGRQQHIALEYPAETKRAMDRLVVMRLLIVENNAKLAGLIAKLLADDVYSVDTVATVSEARAAIDVVDYDLILLDLSLPDGDGGDVLRSLRRSGRATRILVASARRRASTSGWISSMTAPMIIWSSRFRWRNCWPASGR